LLLTCAVSRVLLLLLTTISYSALFFSCGPKPQACARVGVPHARAPNRRQPTRQRPARKTASPTLARESVGIRRAKINASVGIRRAKPQAGNNLTAPHPRALRVTHAVSIVLNSRSSSFICLTAVVLMLSKEARPAITSSNSTKCAFTGSVRVLGIW